MDDGKIPEKNLEKLSKAIINAIMSSNEVKRAMANINSQDILCSKSVMVLIMRLQSLAEFAEANDDNDTNEERHEVNEYKEPEGKQFTPNKVQLIDGKELTANELAFQEYCINKFKEREWLKKIKIFIDDKY